MSISERMTKSGGGLLLWSVTKLTSVSAKVSVCIPTFNRAAFLRESLESVARQTYKSIEVIVCDNASSDGTPDIVHEFADCLTLRYIRQPYNVGMVRNWQAGLTLATGDFISFLNDDDLYHPDALGVLVRALEENPEADFSFADHLVVDRNGRLLDVSTRNLARDTGRVAMRPGMITDVLEQGLTRGRFPMIPFPILATLFRRQILERIGGFRIGAGASLDLDLMLRVASFSRAAYYVDARLASYRLHESQQTTGPGAASRELNNLPAFIFTLEGCRSSARQHRRLVEGVLAAAYARLAWLQSFEDGRAPWVIIWKAARLKPTRTRTVLRLVLCSMRALQLSLRAHLRPG